MSYKRVKVPTPEEVRLTEELTAMRNEHNKLIAVNEKLKLALNSKIIITKRIKKREGLQYFPALAVMIIGQLTKDKRDWAVDMYLKYMSLINYAVVAGIGVIINMIVIYSLIAIFPLFMANGIAILTAFLWNWSLSVGSFGHFMGLKQEIIEEYTYEPSN